MNKIAVKHRIIEGVMLTQVHCTNFITVMAVLCEAFDIKYMDEIKFRTAKERSSGKPSK